MVESSLWTLAGKFSIQSYTCIYPSREKTVKHCKKFTLIGLLWLALLPAYAAMVPTTQFSTAPEPAQLRNNFAQRQQVELQLIELARISHHPSTAATQWRALPPRYERW
jgi:hypothetical protein